MNDNITEVATTTFVVLVATFVAVSLTRVVLLVRIVLCLHPEISFYSRNDTQQEKQSVHFK
jgi:hypothetical protein